MSRLKSKHMRGSLAIFLPKVKKVEISDKMVNHKSQTGLANANIEADDNVVVNEFVPIHLKTTSGIVILLSVIFLIYCILKASKRGTFSKCWRLCCKKEAPMQSETQQACLPADQFPHSQAPLDSAPAERVRLQDIRRAMREVVGQQQPSASAPPPASSGAKKKSRSRDASEC